MTLEIASISFLNSLIFIREPPYSTFPSRITKLSAEVEQ